MKLSDDQVQFIDNYLKNSGVRYTDIRYEMTDHVANAMEETEGDFYENFRNYMVGHKMELMASNRHFKKLARRKAFGILKENTLKIHFWGLALILFAFARLSAPYYGQDEIEDNLQIALIVISSAVYFYFLYYRLFRQNVNSVLDRLLLIVYFGSLVLRLDKIIEGTWLVTLYYSLGISFMLLLVQSIWQLNKMYKVTQHG